MQDDLKTAIGEQTARRQALCAALQAVRGPVRFARLDDIHQTACASFGFRVSLQDALALLHSTPGIYVEHAAQPEASRVLDGRVP